MNADFDAYVVANYDGLVRTARLLTDDWGLAEDLVQTTLVKCWSAWSRIQSDDPGAYVRRALMNTYCSWWRRSKPHLERIVDTEPHTAGTDRYELMENAQILQALRGLPKKMRAVIVLRYYEDLTEAETAAALGCSIGTVKSQTHRALARLRLEPDLQAARKDKP